MNSRAESRSEQRPTLPYRQETGSPRMEGRSVVLVRSGSAPLSPRTGSQPETPAEGG